MNLLTIPLVLIGILALACLAALTFGGDRKAPAPPPGSPGYNGPRQFRPNPPPAPLNADGRKYFDRELDAVATEQRTGVLRIEPGATP